MTSAKLCPRSTVRVVAAVLGVFVLCASASALQACAPRSITPAQRTP